MWKLATIILGNHSCLHNVTWSCVMCFYMKNLFYFPVTPIHFCTTLSNKLFLILGNLNFEFDFSSNNVELLFYLLIICWLWVVSDIINQFFAVYLNAYRISEIAVCYKVIKTSHWCTLINKLVLLKWLYLLTAVNSLWWRFFFVHIMSCLD